MSGQLFTEAWARGRPKVHGDDLAATIISAGSVVDSFGLNGADHLTSISSMHGRTADGSAYAGEPIPAV